MRALIIIGLLLFATTAHSEGDARFNTCKILSGAAQDVLKVRKRGASIIEVLEVYVEGETSLDKFVEYIIYEAYDIPLILIDKERTTEFGNSIFIECMGER